MDIVEHGGVMTAMLDVSFTCHMPDCLEMPYMPAIRGAKAEGNHAYQMGGMSCLAGDVMGMWYFDQPLAVGDTLIFEDMIHYTMVKTTTFNGINLPSIGVWKKEGGIDLLRHFGYEDYKNRLS